MKKKKLLLILPEMANNPYTNNRHSSAITQFKTSFINCTLPTLAALTPNEFDITIADENVQPIPYNGKYDLVGLTGFSTELIRAEKIAKRFRERKIPVLCGGPSVSLCPERWREVSDVLFIGEAEKTWPQFASDFLNGSYQDTYTETERFDLSISPLPDYSLIPRHTLKYYSGGIVQTSRGCPYDCEFCNAVVYVGRKVRYKPVENIIREMESLYKLGLRLILLGDDNFSANRKTAKAILRAIIDWKKSNKISMNFISLISVDTGSDEELLDLFFQAGVNRIFIGIETPNVESLKETGKHHNLRTNMFEAIETFKKKGIFIHGGSMVGFDNDDLSIFRRQFDFFQKAGIPNVQVYPLQALDKTRLKERMVREGRYLDWATELKKAAVPSFLNFHTIVPKQMSVQQLREGLFWLLWTLYDYDNYLERVKKYFETFPRTGKLDLHLREENPFDLSRSVKLFLNIARHILLRADMKERWFFAQLLLAAAKSSHPQRMVIAIFSYISCMNVRNAVKELYPDVEGVQYPT